MDLPKRVCVRMRVVKSVDVCEARTFLQMCVHVINAKTTPHTHPLLQHDLEHRRSRQMNRMGTGLQNLQKG